MQVLGEGASAAGAEVEVAAALALSEVVAFTLVAFAVVNAVAAFVDEVAAFADVAVAFADVLDTFADDVVIGTLTGAEVVIGTLATVEVVAALAVVDVVWHVSAAELTPDGDKGVAGGL